MDAKYQWQMANTANEEAVAQLTSELKMSSVTAQILVNRGYQTTEQVQQFLQPQLTDCYDPFLMHDMQRAVDRIQAAIEQGQQITVYGDYDADGLTSTAVMYETLLTIGAEVNYYVPNRFSDGYGPNEAAFNRLIDAGTQLIVTVDNGVAGNAAIDAANARGVDVVVTDHHELPDQLPAAYAIVHPRYPGGQYPFGDLSGVGVAFKVAWALLEELPVELLDLVAIGEIADLVSVTDENRILITYGIQQLHTGMRPGIHELVKLAGINEQTINETNIGFGIAPRLNALGRMGDANPGVELLTTLEEDTAAPLAKMVDQKNQERQALVSEIAEAALTQAQQPENQARHVLLLSGQGWHVGVLGIVASRIVEQTGKPTVVLGIDEETGLAKGSGRSIAGFDLFQAINGFRDLTTAFGGHQMAVGLTITAANLEQLQAGLAQSPAVQQLSSLAKPQLNVAATLTPDQASLDLYHDLTRLAPFGPGNEQPTFLIEGWPIVGAKQIGKTGDHLKFAVQGKQTQLNAVAFNQGPAASAVQAAADQVAVVGTLDDNEWHGHHSVQLMVKDVKIAGTPVIDARTNRLAPALFEAPGLYLCFSQALQKRLTGQVSATLVNAEDVAEDQLIDQPVVLVDCPNSAAELRQVFRVGGQPTSIRVFAYQTDEAYLTGMPSRQEFGRLFKFTQTHRDVNVRRQLGTLSQFLKIERNQLIFMIQLFFEVGFVKIEDGVLNGVDNPPTVELSSANTYQKREQLINTEKALVYSDSKDLRRWVLDCIASD